MAAAGAPRMGQYNYQQGQPPAASLPTMPPPGRRLQQETPTRDNVTVNSCDGNITAPNGTWVICAPSWAHAYRCSEDSITIVNVTVQGDGFEATDVLVQEPWAYY